MDSTQTKEKGKVTDWFEFALGTHNRTVICWNTLKEKDYAEIMEDPETRELNYFLKEKTDGWREITGTVR